MYSNVRRYCTQAKPRGMLNRFALHLPACFSFDLDCTVVTNSVHDYLHSFLRVYRYWLFSGSGAWLPGHSSRRHGFSTGPVRMRFVVGKVVVGQDFLRILRVSLVSTMPLMVHTHSFILYWCCVILIIDSFVIQKQNKKNFPRVIPKIFIGAKNVSKKRCIEDKCILCLMIYFW